MLGKKGPATLPGKAFRSRDPAGRKGEIDYRRYRLAPRDWARCFGMSLGLTGVVAYLFYRSIWGMVLFFGVFPAILYRQRSRGARLRQKELQLQFKECIRVLTASLYAGYSVENAFLEAQKELTQQLGEEAIMCRELAQINSQLRLNVPVETLIESLAGRSGVEEITTFGQVFGYAKHNGSNFTSILKDTAQRIEDRIELERELQTLIAAKQLEQKIMDVIPLGILFFVQVTSPGFLDVMYQGLVGRGIMSICLAVYAIAYYLSERLMRMEV